MKGFLVSLMFLLIAMLLGGLTAELFAIRAWFCVGLGAIASLWFLFLATAAYLAD